MVLLRAGAVAALLLTGCVSDVDRALAATATAERRIGKSGATALDGVAALTSVLAATTSRAGPVLDGAAEALRGVASITSEVRGITADARANVEGGWLTKRLLVVGVCFTAVSTVHAIVAHWRLKRHIRRLHDAVKQQHPPTMKT